MRRLAILVWLVAALALPVGDAGAGGSACAGFGPMARAGALTDPRLVELSGLAASRRHAGVLWAHNDSGGQAEVFALGLDGAARGVFPIPGASAIDWEDMAVGPGPGSGSYLYLGDIGDNRAERSTVTVYRVAEPAGAPSAPGAPLGAVEAIQLEYPSGPADAEALLVDPRSGELVIVTKALSGTSRVLSAPASSLHGGSTVTMADRGTIQIPLPAGGGAGLPGTMVTGGDVSPDGSVVALRTYRSVLLYPRGSRGSVVDALKRGACFGPQAQEPQGEAVGFTRDGASIITISEGSRAPVHRSGKAVAATTSTTARSTPTTSGSSGGPDGGGTTTPAGDGSTTTSPGATTVDRSTTTSRDGGDRSGDGDRRGDGDEDGDRSEADTSAPAASARGDDGLSPIVLLVPVVVVAGAGSLVWVRRRRSAPG